jgi:hypothetical protein
MNDDSLIPRGGGSDLIGGDIVGRRNLSCERGLALLGQGLGPVEGERRSSIDRGRGQSCRVPSRDAFGLKNVCGKMLAIDGSSEVDVTTRFRRHPASGGRPRGPHPEGHDGDSQCADLRGEWHPDQSCSSSQGRAEESVQNSTLRAEALC